MIVGPASAFPFVAAPSSSHVGCEPPAHSRASSRTSSPRSSGGPHTSGVVASAKVIPAAYAGLGLALLSRAGGAGAWSGGPLIAQGGARFNRSTRVAQPPLATIDNSRYTLAQSVPRAPHCTDTLVIKTHYTRPRTVPTHSLTRHTLPVAREQIPETAVRHSRAYSAESAHPTVGPRPACIPRDVSSHVRKISPPAARAMLYAHGHASRLKAVDRTAHSKPNRWGNRVRRGAGHTPTRHTGRKTCRKT